MNSGQTTYDEKPGIARTDRLDQRMSSVRAAAGIREFLSTLAFLSAVAMPALYLPLLIDGIETIDRLGLFMGLFGLHVLALVGGRRRHVES